MSKLFMALAFVWFIVSLVGGVMSGSIASATTGLTASISDAATTINVVSTTGFPSSGVLMIDNEQIAYSTKSATAFSGSVFNPLVRGAGGTDAVAHTGTYASSGKTYRTPVRTVSSYMLNASSSYQIAAISDTAGFWGAITLPVHVFQLIIGYLTLPIGFLGTDLQILAYVWAIVVGGMILTIVIQMAGSRRI